MDILQVRAKNINSLYGNWSIDFSVPEFREQGIFALTGPTGSGKTSILDSICIALYGQTPRLGSITKSQNHIMSRGTGECFAEVIFRVPSGTYRTFWSQARARNKGNGNLQAPKHEISQVNTGEILAEKVSTVPPLVEKLTGLDFARFTRSILLPQGEFANFLQATEDLRSPILEKITGTHIYTLISQRIYDTVKTQNDELIGLRQLKDSISLLSNAQVEELEQRMSDTQTNLQTLETKIVILEEKIQWREEIEKYESEWREYFSLAEIAKQNLRDLTAEKTRFARARQAERIYPFFLQYADTEQKLNEIQQKISLKTEEIEQNLLKKTQVEEQIETKNSEKTQTDQGKKIFDAIMPRVQFLDTAIAHSTFQIHSILQNREEKRAENLRIENILADLRHQLGQSQKYIQSLQAQISQIDPANTLHEITELLHKQGQHRDELVTQRKKFEQEIEILEQATQDAWEIFTHDSTQADHSQQEIIQAQQEIEQIEYNIAHLLSDKDLAYWENTLNGIREFLLKIEQFQRDQHECRNILAEHSILERKYSVRIQELRENEKKSDAVHELWQKKEQALIAVRGKTAVLNREITVQSLQAELMEGAACSVCGSTEHPAAAGKQHNRTEEDLVADLSDLAEKITHIEVELSVLQTQKNDLAIEIAKIQLIIAQEKKELSLLQQKVGVLSTKIVQFWDDLSSQAMRWNLLFSLDTIVQQSEIEPLGQENSAEIHKLLTAHYQDVESKVNIIKKHHTELYEQHQRLLGINKTHNTYLQMAHTSQVNLQFAQQKQAQFVQHIADLTAEIICIEQDMRSAANRNPAWSAQVDSDNNEMTDPQIGTMQTWFENNAFAIANQRTEIAEHTQNAYGISQEITRHADLAQILADATHQLTQQLNDLEAYTFRLQLRRQALFADKDLITEEKRYQEILRAQESEKNHLVQQSALLELSVHNDKSFLQELLQDLHKTQEKIKEQYNFFTTQLEENNFSNEEDFLASRIATEEIVIFEESYAEMEKNSAQIQAVLRKISDDLHMVKEKQLTEQCLAELIEENSAIHNHLAQVQEEYRELHQQYTFNAQQITQYNNIHSTIQSTQEKNQVWYTLNELIGSRDGKAYRNFAQGLTFQLLIHNANVQLGRMTDRYVLMADPEKALELKVIDQYLAEEIRSTKNLSGGESFIVSLALALGLANISNMNIPIDSLFLDEGFGTLDEEALDHALDALALLQTEGKKIGIISHIPTLKERIAIHIQIDPIGGGRSLISGPGCVHQMK